MAIFKCKMCGGTIEFEPGATVGVCDSCGTKQTLPRLDDDKKANLYDRADHFRRNNDFDKAMGIYEQILNEDGTDAEAYWSLVLCRYGIEYVEDPATHKRVPTVNRAQFTSVFADEDYKSALQHADVAQKILYEEEAKAIDAIQKGILEISQKEEPFDVFICYKETDANGRRTQDSVLANDLYHQLTQEGFKVFFSRITLEDKLGTAYEPYIFAALNSAKAMVVLGTKPEYFNAVWVKNEWSRYLALIKNGAKKTLIPAYRDMDPYDLPEEFSHLQAQDMSKLGFMQDLIRGIKKILEADAPKPAVKETVVVGGSNVNTAPLLKRAFMFLEDGNWKDADDYCEKVLDQDPENAEAYLGKLIAELKVGKRENLKHCAQPFDGSSNYQKVLRFGDAALADELKGDIAFIKDRNETNRKTGIYTEALGIINKAGDETKYRSAAAKFKSISGFKDADALAAQCLEKAELAHKEAEERRIAEEKAAEERRIAEEKAAEERRRDSVYAKASALAVKQDIPSVEQAIEKFQSISGWKDSNAQIELCRKKIEEIKAKEEADRQEAERQRMIREREEKLKKEKNKKIGIICGIAAVVVIAAVIVLTTVVIPNNKYKTATELLSAGNYDEAYQILVDIKNNKNAKASLCNIADEMIGDNRYDEAIDILNQYQNYSKATAMTSYCYACGYMECAETYDQERFNTLKDSCREISQTDSGKTKAVNSYSNISDSRLREAIQKQDQEYSWKIDVLEEAAVLFERASGYRDSGDRIARCSQLTDELKSEKESCAAELMRLKTYGIEYSLVEEMLSIANKFVDAGYAQALKSNIFTSPMEGFGYYGLEYAIYGGDNEQLTTDVCSIIEEWYETDGLVGSGFCWYTCPHLPVDDGMVSFYDDLQSLAEFAEYEPLNKALAAIDEATAQ